MIENKTKKLEEKYIHNKHSEAWKIIREISGGSDTPLRISTLGSAAQNKDNWQKHFSELLGNISQPPGESFEPIVRIIDTELPINTSSFTMDELDNALGKSKSNAVGPDNIPLEIWKSEMFKSKLLQLCNRTYVDNNLKPKEWSKSNIVPIHKKGSKGDPSNYRGISLNSIAAKVYNKMLLHRIQPHIDPILSWTQAGFRKSRSTLSNILALRRIIEGIRLKNIPLTMVFVDFCKAFDSINRDQMFKILEAYGIPNEIINAIKVIYKDNIAAVITPTGLTEFFRVLSGIFQGDTLAPFLFIIVIDYVLRKTYRACPGAGIDLVPRRGSRQPATHLGDLSYADDVTLLSYYRDKAQELLHSLEQAASQVGLLVNADKTKVMSINNSTTPQLVTASNTPSKIQIPSNISVP